MPRSTYDDRKGRRACQLYEQLGSYNAVGKEMGITDSTAKAWINRYGETKPKQPRKRKTNGVSADLGAMADLQHRIEFLEWWNTGERKGFVDLLLKELDK